MRGPAPLSSVLSMTRRTGSLGLEPITLLCSWPGGERISLATRNARCRLRRTACRSVVSATQRTTSSRLRPLRRGLSRRQGLGTVGRTPTGQWSHACARQPCGGTRTPSAGQVPPGGVGQRHPVATLCWGVRGEVLSPRDLPRYQRDKPVVATRLLPSTSSAMARGRRRYEGRE